MQFVVAAERVVKFSEINAAVADVVCGALKGKKKCVAMSKQILKVLIDLLGQESDEVFVVQQRVDVH